MKLSEIAAALDARLVGNGDLEIERPVHPSDATGPRDLALAMEPSTKALLAGSSAKAAVVSSEAKIPPGVLDGYIVVGRARLAMARLMEIYDRPIHVEPGIHPTAVIAPDAELGRNVSIGPLCYIGPKAKLGDGVVLVAQVTVGAEASIGPESLLHPGARIGERVVIGARVIIHHNASIGADGFSFVTPEPGSVDAAKADGEITATNQTIARINSIGTVIVGDDVEIGACTAIDRATVSATRIGRGTKIDDLVMIGHNCVIGENCMLCGHAGVAGSTTLGDRVVLGGRVGVGDHLTIGSDTVIAGGALIGSNVASRSLLLGYPPLPPPEAHLLHRNIRHLGKLFATVETLKAKVEELSAQGADRKGREPVG